MVVELIKVLRHRGAVSQGGGGGGGGVWVVGGGGGNHLAKAVGHGLLDAVRLCWRRCLE